MSKFPPRLTSEEAIALNAQSADLLNRALAVRGIDFKIEKRGEHGYYEFSDVLHALAVLVEDLVDETCKELKTSPGSTLSELTQRPSPKDETD